MTAEEKQDGTERATVASSAIFFCGVFWNVGAYFKKWSCVESTKNVLKGCMSKQQTFFNDLRVMTSSRRREVLIQQSCRSNHSGGIHNVTFWPCTPSRRQMNASQNRRPDLAILTTSAGPVAQHLEAEFPSMQPSLLEYGGYFGCSHAADFAARAAILSNQAVRGPATRKHVRKEPLNMVKIRKICRNGE